MNKDQFSNFNSLDKENPKGQFDFHYKQGNNFNLGPYCNITDNNYQLYLYTQSLSNYYANLSKFYSNLNPIPYVNNNGITYPIDLPNTNYYVTQKVLENQNANIHNEKSNQNITCHNTNILINNINTNNPNKLVNNLCNSDAFDTLNFQDQGNENKMIGKIRERSIKNNKLVYVHTKVTAPLKKKSLNNKDSSNENNKKTFSNEEDSKDIEKKRSRGSKFRGVSRNGNQWQVLIMVNKKKRYVGSYETEEVASRTYDKVCIQNHGTKAKTNYFYTQAEILEILNSPKILKIEQN